MTQKKVLILDQLGSPWYEFLAEFFEDTSAQVEKAHEVKRTNPIFDDLADVVFVNEHMLTPTLISKLKFKKQTTAGFRIFAMGPVKEHRDFPFDSVFELPSSLSQFQRQLVQFLPLPEKIKLQVIDDEPDVGTMLMDYLDHRTNPAFDVFYAENGQKGLEAIEVNKPNLVILDIKMPVMTGHEVYRTIKEKKLDLPVIIFFDAVSGDEIMRIHEIGRPAIVEKGSQQTAMPEMLALIKKIVYFG